MASSEVAIANRALQILGAKRISSLSQDAPNARSMNTAFVPVRDALLRRYDWNFAIKRASVAASATDDLYEGLKRYQLPNDFGRLLRERNTSFFQEQRRDWQIEEGHILTKDGAPLQFRYVALVTDPALFDPLFAEALSAKLAVETALDIPGSTSKRNNVALQAFDDAITVARQANAFENDSDDLVEDTWIGTMRSPGFTDW